MKLKTGLDTFGCIIKEDSVKGTIYLSLSQIIFFLTGYVVHVGLARILAPNSYGNYSIVISLVTFINLILTTGIPRAVSKYCSENKDKTKSIVFGAVKITAFLGLIVSLIYFFSSGLIASIFKDDSLKEYVRISSLAIPAYSVFFVFGGGLNGLKKYKDQALSQIIYLLIKPVLIIFLAKTLMSTSGAVLGFSLSPIFGLLFAMRLFARDYADEASFPVKKVIDFAIPVTLFSLVVNFLQNLDLYSLKILMPSSEDVVGFYSAASALSKPLQFLPNALMGVIFPIISSSTYNKNYSKTKTNISRITKFTILVLGILSIFLLLFSKKIILLLYPDNYLPSVQPFRILVLGMIFFSLFNLFLTIISGANYPKISLKLGVLTLTFSCFLNYVLIKSFGMMGAAWATTISSAFGSLIAGAWIKKNIFSMNKEKHKQSHV